MRNNRFSKSRLIADLNLKVEELARTHGIDAENVSVQFYRRNSEFIRAYWELRAYERLIEDIEFGSIGVRR